MPFAIMSPMNFTDWKLGISGSICAPCSNCKGQFRDLIQYYELEERCNIHYTGLVEFIVNAMVDTPMKYLEEEVVEEVIPVPTPVESPSEVTG